MKKIIILFIFFSFCYSCGNNIIIKDPKLKKTILKFYKDAQYYSGQNLDNVENRNVISVAISQDRKDLRIGLYSFVKLNRRNYIGNSKINSLNIFFYSDNVEIAKELLEIKFEINKQDTNEDFAETYTEFYKYRNGKLELITGN